MSYKNNEYWRWRNKETDEEDERKRQKRRNELMKSFIQEGNAEASMELIKDEFVILPSDPPFAKKLLNDMKGKKQEILLLIHQNLGLVPNQVLSELSFKIVDIDLRWPDAGDMLDNLREKLEYIIRKYEDENLKTFLMDMQILIMDLVIMHGEYLNSMQEWNRSLL